jgi:hypothetical protein
MRRTTTKRKFSPKTPRQIGRPRTLCTDRQLITAKKVLIGDLEYRVCIVRDDTLADRAMDAESDGLGLGHTEGLTDFHAGRIYIRDRGDNPTRMLSTLVHEILHASLEASGVVRLIRSYARAFGRDESDVEEDLVAALSPVLVTALRSAGLLRG